MMHEGCGQGLIPSWLTNQHLPGTKYTQCDVFLCRAIACAVVCTMSYTVRVVMVVPICHISYDSMCRTAPIDVKLDLHTNLALCEYIYIYMLLHFQPMLVVVTVAEYWSTNICEGEVKEAVPQK